VSTDGREGELTMDLRPAHQFVKVRWLDDFSESDCVAADSFKLVTHARHRTSVISEDFRKGDKVAVDCREGIVIMDLRPAQQFIKLQWLDDGTDSGVIASRTVVLVSKEADTTFEL